ncbi:hypothetical protein ANTPLA_LOCUS2381 [Anthophora plagiata]
MEYCHFTCDECHVGHCRRLLTRGLAIVTGQQRKDSPKIRTNAVLNSANTAVFIAQKKLGSENASQGTKRKLRKKKKVARSSAAPAKGGKVNGTRCLLGYPLAPCSSPVNESKLISSSV